MTNEAAVLPPSDLDAEAALLGSILIDGAQLPALVSSLTPAAFYRDRHGFIYEAMLSLLEQSVAIDQITVASELARTARLEASGGAAYLSHLVSVVPTSAYAEYYAGIVAQMWRLRRLIEVGQEIAKSGYGRDDFDDTVAAAIGKLSDLHSELTAQRESLGPHERAEALMERYIELRDKPAGIPFGIADLDFATGGAQPGDVDIVASQTGLGKSTLLRQMAMHMARSGMVLFVSAEMSLDQLGDRDVAAASGLNITTVARGNYSDADYDRILAATGAVSEMAVHDYAPPNPTTALILAEGRRLQTQGHDLRAVFVDYLQMLGDVGAKGENENQRIGRIMRGLKAMARQLYVPVIAAAQLNRSSWATADKRPTLAALRDSGSIENDADLVLLLYRDDYYYSDIAWQLVNPGKPYPAGVVELRVAKHRQGLSNVMLKLRWDAARQRMVSG